MKDLRNKVVLITGAAHGIGRETALAFAREGARLVLADVQQARLDETVSELKRAGHDVLGIQVDLRRREQVYEMIDRSGREMGPIDVLVNNAGVVHAMQITDLTEEQIEDMIDVNLKAPIWTTKRLLPEMIERRSGHIVNIGSVAGKITLPYLSVYCATKSAVIGFTDTIYQELHRYGVHTSLVNPGFVDSGMFKGAGTLPMIPWVSPRFIAEAIVRGVKANRLELHAPRIIWIGGFLRLFLGQRTLSWVWRRMRVFHTFGNVVGYD